MKKINECVGKIVKGINTTSDVDIHSIKTQSKKFGNDVTDDGDPLYNVSQYFKYLKKDLKESWLQKTEKRTDIIIDNPKFKNWFKGSKVVDSKGKPLVCFHGTKVTFNSFRPLSHFGTIGAASEFVKNSYIGENIIPVYLSISKPMKIKDFANPANCLGFDLWESNIISLSQLIEIYGNETKENIDSVIKNEGVSLKTIQKDPGSYIDTGYEINVESFISIIKSKGYDGLYYLNEFEDKGSISWIILDSNQVWPIFKNSEDINEGLDDHKHIMKNNWDYPEELMLWLFSNKFKKIGKGSFSTVFKQENSNIVIKVIGTGTWNQEDEMFDKWYDFCKQNKSKFLPKFGSIKDFNSDNKKYQIVFTENLSEIPRTKLFSIIAIGNIIKHFYTENNITDEQFNKIVRVVDDKEDIPQIKEMIPLLQSISKNFSKSNLDIQLSNFMMRNDTIVINDIIGQKKKGW